MILGENAMSIHRQRGMTFIGIVLALAAAAFVAMVAVKLVPHYLQFAAVKSVMDELKNEPDVVSRGQEAVLDTVDNRLYINEVRTVPRKNFKYKRVPGPDIGVAYYELGVSYEAREAIFGNLDALMTFSHQVTLSSK